MDTLKVLISIAIGSALGAFISLEYLPESFFWVGTLAGGLVGFISWEFKKVLQAIPEAWRKARSYKINTKRNKIIFLSCIMFSIMALIVVLNSLVFLFLPLAYFNPVSFEGMTVVLFYSSPFMFLFWILFIISPKISYSRKKSYFSIKREFITEKEDTKEVLLKWNPFSILFYQVPRFIGKVVKLIIFTLMLIPTLLKFLGSFTVTLFKEIYSDVRLLCGIHAALGSLVGFFAGSVVIGILIGCVAGLVSYEVLSKRVFGLIPKKA